LRLEITEIGSRVFINMSMNVINSRWN
jgi:hypothetical protein